MQQQKISKYSKTNAYRVNVRSNIYVLCNICLQDGGLVQPNAQSV